MDKYFTETAPSVDSKKNRAVQFDDDDVEKRNFSNEAWRIGALLHVSNSNLLVVPKSDVEKFHSDTVEALN